MRTHHSLHFQPHKGLYCNIYSYFLQEHDMENYQQGLYDIQMDGTVFKADKSGVFTIRSKMRTHHFPSSQPNKGLNCNISWYYLQEHDIENNQIEFCNDSIEKFTIQIMKSDRFSIGSEMGTRHSLHWTFNEEIFCSKS